MRVSLLPVYLLNVGGRLEIQVQACVAHIRGRYVYVLQSVNHRDETNSVAWLSVLVRRGSGSISAVLAVHALLCVSLRLLVHSMVAISKVTLVSAVACGR